MTNLKRALFGASISFCVFGFCAPAAQASEQEHVAVVEFQHAANSLLESGQQEQRGETARQLNHLYFETEKRLTEMSRFKALGLSSNDEFATYLRETLVPSLKAWGAEHGQTFERAQYENDLRELRLQIQRKEAALKSYYGALSKRHPLLGRVTALTSFARSETLSDGTIGDWNPADSQRIQDSAIAGLNTVLDRIDLESTDGKTKAVKNVVTRLTEYHALLLGEAQHHFSQPGRLNEIVFKTSEGRRVPVREYLDKWESDFGAKSPSSLEAHRLSTQFLFLHPFGDSNGRIAEVSKQMVLKAAGLPPLLTFEKTAAENYAYQPMFGIGSEERSVLKQLNDTEAFLKSWERSIGPEGVIHDVQLSGNNVIARVGTATGEKIIVSTRVYLVNSADPLPPIKGAVVAVDRKAEDVSLRFTLDGWKTHDEVRPASVVTAERMGRVKVAFPLFVFDAPKRGPNSTLSFAFRYDHPHAGEIWFSNGGRNYNQNWLSPVPGVPARSGVMCSALFLRRPLFGALTVRSPKPLGPASSKALSTSPSTSSPSLSAATALLAACATGACSMNADSKPGANGR